MFLIYTDADLNSLDESVSLPDGECCPDKVPENISTAVSPISGTESRPATGDEWLGGEGGKELGTGEGGKGKERVMGLGGESSREGGGREGCGREGGREGGEGGSEGRRKTMNSAVILFMYLQILASQMKNHLWMTHLLVYCLQKVTTLIIHNLMKMLAPPMFYLVKVLTPSVLMKWVLTPSVLMKRVLTPPVLSPLLMNQYFCRTMIKTKTVREIENNFLQYF